jgi:hypothetical protein
MNGRYGESQEANMIPLQYPATSYGQDRYDAAALYARRASPNMVWRESWMPRPPSSPMGILVHYPPHSVAASRLALEQETREFLYAEYRARELSHMAAASRYGPPPGEAAAILQAPPTHAAVPAPPPAPSRAPPRAAAPTAPPPKEAAVAPASSKKSADELAAAAVLAALMGRKEEEPAPTQVVEGYRHSSLQSKKPHTVKKNKKPKQLPIKKQHQSRSPAQTAIYESHKLVSSAMSKRIYRLPTTAIPPPAPGHVSDENSSTDDASSSDEGSRAGSPVPSAGGCVDPAVMDGTKWCKGIISLSLPEDDDVLSPLHCFMRRYCVEAFSASPEDVSTPRYGKSHGFKVEVGQVGIRCLYCKHQPVGKRPERAVCYPSSLRNIYHSIETWQRRHSLVCTHITPWVRKSIVELMESSKTRAGGRRQYWEDSARRLGMLDTARGVRFFRTPGDEGPPPPSPQGKRAGNATTDSSITNVDAKPVVREDDKDLVTDYLFLLMEQMQTCKFTEEDRTGGRSKIKDNHVGFPGMECRHCLGRAGFGRYFPSSISALSLANSDRNVFNHLQKCRRCPSLIKTELVRLSKDQSQSKNRRGLRKLFFNRIWNRIHDEELATPTTSNAGRVPGEEGSFTRSATTVQMAPFV